MDISKYLAFGDQHLANQYYVLLSPMGFVFLAGLALLPWIGAWRAGARGLMWIVGAQLLCIVGVNANA